MKIKKQITVEIEIDELNHEHCAHTEFPDFIKNQCLRSFDEGGESYCRLFNILLKINHGGYPIRCSECIRKFGMR